MLAFLAAPVGHVAYFPHTLPVALLLLLLLLLLPVPLLQSWTSLWPSRPS
jgi:hypothetical protein